MGKAHGQIAVHDVVDADEPGVRHRPGKAIAAAGVGRGAMVLGKVLTEVFPAHRLVALLSFPAAEEAAFVAEEFHLFLQGLGQRIQPVKRPVQAEIRHHVEEILTSQLALQLLEFRQYLGGGGNQIEPRIASLDVIEQQIRMEDHAVSGPLALLEAPAERIASPVGKMLFAQKGIAECQPGGDPVLPHQRQNRLRIAISGSDPAAAPDAVRWSAVDRADIAPIIEVLSVPAEQRQKHAIQIVELKQSGKVVIGGARLRFGSHGNPPGILDCGAEASCPANRIIPSCASPIKRKGLGGSDEPKTAE